jgi:hypothetical protein
MPTPIGTLEFFALEAGEYLERLAQLAAKPGGPAADELVRYARALRGSALMANQQPMSRAAGGLEALGRALREGRRQWDPGCTEVAGQAVDELKGLLRHVTQWGPDDDARAGRVSEGLQALAGPAPEQAGRRTGERRAPAGPDAGVRAFVSREAALVAGALDRSARALEADPADAASLHTVLRRMQSLRGLASLGDLPPLPDILDGVERAVAAVARAAVPPTGAAEVFTAAARALNRASTEVAGAGRPDPAAPETAAFAERLVAAFAGETGVVPVESLAPAAGEAIAVRGREPAAPTPTTLELVGQGEYLVQAADDIERAGVPALRGLRLHALAAMLEGAARPAEPALRAALGRLLERARAVSSPAFDPGPELLAALREAGAALRGITPATDLQGLGERLAPTERRIDGATGRRRDGATERPAAVPARAAEPSSHRAAEPVPITDLLAEPGDLAGSFTTLARLRATSGAESPSRGAAEPVLDVRDLVYRGRRALERALELRSALAGRLAEGEPAERWRPLLDELFDLLPLATEDT